MNDRVVTLDVREEIRSGREPFSKIMKAVADLAEGETLRLLAPFEPAPLYAVLGRQGFSHQTSKTETGDWEIVFSRAAGGTPQTSGSLGSSITAPAQAAPAATQSEDGLAGSTLEVDARGLEPPQPMVRILESLRLLPQGHSLRAYTDRRPMHLYVQLEERGYVGVSEERADGSFVTFITRR